MAGPAPFPEAVLAAFADDPSIATRRMMGTNCLMVGGRLFCIALGPDLAVKLPSARAAEEMERGAPAFAPGGRRMRQWIAIPRDRAAEWPALAVEARRYVEVLASATPVAGMHRRRS